MSLASVSLEVEGEAGEGAAAAAAADAASGTVAGEAAAASGETTATLAGRGLGPESNSAAFCANWSRFWFERKKTLWPRPWCAALWALRCCMQTVSLHVRQRATEVRTWGAASSWHMVHGTCGVQREMRDA